MIEIELDKNISLDWKTDPSIAYQAAKDIMPHLADIVKVAGGVDWETNLPYFKMLPDYFSDDHDGIAEIFPNTRIPWTGLNGEVTFMALDHYSTALQDRPVFWYNNIPFVGIMNFSVEYNCPETFLEIKLETQNWDFEVEIFKSTIVDESYQKEKPLLKQNLNARHIIESYPGGGFTTLLNERIRTEAGLENSNPALVSQMDAIYHEIAAKFSKTNIPDNLLKNDPEEFWKIYEKIKNIVLDEGKYKITPIT